MARTTDIKGIPGLLKKTGRFCVWKYEQVSGRKGKTKVPYDAGTGRRARTDDSGTFRDFATAVEAYVSGGYDGMGILTGNVGAIDIDRCLLMRENAHDDALKLYQSLCARNLQSEKMDLLSLCFDIDAGNYEDARKKIDTLANSANLIIRIPALEKCIQLQQKCGDDEDAIRKTAQRLLEIAPDSVIANQVLA